MKKDKFAPSSDSSMVHEGKLNELIEIVTIRPDGSRRIQWSYENCPTLTEQHTAHLTDINYLMERYQPDELAAYISARSQYRQEIIGHDFSREPDLQGAKNIVYQSRKAFEALPDDLKSHFKNHVEFLKFIDNPQNCEKMIKLGLLKEAQLEKLKIPDETAVVVKDATRTTKEDKDATER